MDKQPRKPGAGLPQPGRSMSPEGDVRDPIAIIGIGCRYPGASNPEELWKLLMEGRDAVGSYPGRRFAELDSVYEQARRKPGRILTDRGGFLKDVAGFDAQFFEISPRESIYIDPQHRLLLEVAWEALEDAGQVRRQYEGSLAGVYTGLWTSEYETRLYESATKSDFYSIPGCGRHSASGRISFSFGLQGPSVAVDTACSSSLVAVHMACQALWADEIEMALAGGTNLILGPELTELFTEAKMLSPDGRCKFGDASANGFVRSEGAGIVVLKRLSRALTDNDPIYALIRGGAVNNDGRSGGLLVTPSVAGQQEMLKAAWTAAGVNPEDFRYVEAHGTGTSVGDPVEIEALGTTLADAGVKTPCVIGSIKTNIGHTESAAGVAGLIKATLVLQHRMVPPSLHFKTPNPKIAWKKFPVRVADGPVNLADQTAPLLAGVSSFGITGTNAHVVLQEAEHQAEDASQGDGPFLLPVSARSQEALQALLEAHWKQSESAESMDSPYPIRDVCYTASVRRTHHEYRVAIVADGPEEMRVNLAAAIAGEDCEFVATDHIADGGHKIVFVAPGQGSQWLGMAREMFEYEPTFREVFKQCDQAIQSETGWSLIDRVIGAKAEQYRAEIDVIQPALFAMSVALAADWRSWGIEPDAVVGHSMGEVAAAHIAGILSLTDAVAVICRRSRLMKALRGAGSMATVALPLTEVESLIAGRSGVSIAASNGPETTVVSGDSKEVEALLKDLEANEIYCRLVKVDVASHSSQVDSILDSLKAGLAGVRPLAAQIPMLSTVTGEYATSAGSAGTVMDAAYWADNLRHAVMLRGAVQKLAQDGHDTFVELSPHPILLPSIEASAHEVSPGALVIPSLRREKPERKTLLTGLASLYSAGRGVDWARLYPQGSRCVRLPQYPFQNERCWPEPADAARGHRTQMSDGVNPLLGYRFESSLQPNAALWETTLDFSSVPFLNDHRVLRSAIFPASGYVDMALSAVRELRPDENFEARNLKFLTAAYIPDRESKTFQTALIPSGEGEFSFEILSRGDEGEAAWPLRAKGVLRRVGVELSAPARVSIGDWKRECGTHLSSEDHYATAARSGLEYGPAFRKIQEVWVEDGKSLCRLKGDSEDYGASVLDPTILDACFQTILHILPEEESFRGDDTLLPIAMERLSIYHAVPEDGELFVHSQRTDVDRKRGTFRVDIGLLDSKGDTLVEAIGFEVKRVAQEGTPAEDLLYSLHWLEEKSREIAGRDAERALATLSNVSSEKWVIFADNTGTAAAMKESIEYLGGQCTLVRVGTGFGRIGEAEFEIDPGSRQDLDRLFEEVASSSGVPTAVIHLWSLEREPHGMDAQALLREQACRSQHVPWVVQAISAANWAELPRLWLVTSGVIPVGDPSRLPNIGNAPIWGIGRAVARENAELRTALVDLSDTFDPWEARALARRICSPAKEDCVALRGDSTYIARLAHSPAQVQEPVTHPLAEAEEYRIEVSSTGLLDNLELRACAHVSPAPGEVAIHVTASGLNFIDLAKVMGIYPGVDPADPVRLGIECAGVVAAIGSGVRGVNVGDAVIAVTPSITKTSLFSSRISVPAELVFRKPPQLSPEEAATTPIAFLTAYYSLIELAHIRRGEWALIHATAGGVGLAALEIAKWIGVEVIATTGSEERANYLKSLGVTHILDSRSSSFAKGVMEITGGRGVNVVLNSLAGELQTKGLEVLAPYGRFIELGKKDIYENRRVGLKVFQRNISFHAVDLAAAIEERPVYVAGVLREIMGHIEAGDWHPLPVTSFSAAEPNAPFRWMAEARHVGKLAFRMDRSVRVLPATDTPLFSPKATYIITGGLGGVALKVAEWMAENGAGHLVLLSRRAASVESKEAADRVVGHGERWGTTVAVAQADITNEADIAGALATIHASGSPLKGIMHAAAVTEDALVADLSPEKFLPVFAPKLKGTWNLHTATVEENLDFFVLFSSIAVLHPQPGMGSYAAANSFLDAFARYRRALGKPAASVNWSGWEQTGLADIAGSIRSMERYEEEGVGSLPVQAALSILKHVIEADTVESAAILFNGNRMVEFFGRENVPILYSELISKAEAGVAESGHTEVLDHLAMAKSVEEHHEIMERFLQEILGRVLKLASTKIDCERPLGSMGLDSLMGIELVRRLSNALQIAIPATVVFNYPTVKRLATHLLRRLDPGSSETAARVMEKPANGPVQKERKNALDSLNVNLSEEDALEALMGDGRRSF